MLLKIISCVRYLAQQGLPFRGDGVESNSNFLSLLSLRTEDDAAFGEWLKRKDDKYTCHQVQNEILKIMASEVLQEVSSSLHRSPFLTVMIDETTDVSNCEQATIVLRQVTEEMEVFEEFLGAYQVPSIDSSTLTKVVKDVLCRYNLSLGKLRGQCYDGASAMQGARSGVATRICEEEPHALYTHCYGHSINLAASDAIKRTKVMKRAMETAHEITKLVKYSPRREQIFHNQKVANNDHHGPGLRVLCPTHWTMRADSLSSIELNYTVLQSTWMEALEVAHDTETKARITGVQAQMKEFAFYFGVVLGELILRHTDMLNQTLQKRVMSAAEGQEVARMTISTLKSIRDSASFVAFWKKVTQSAAKYDIEETELPRKRKLPRQFDDGQAPPEFSSCVEDHYRQVYFGSS